MFSCFKRARSVPLLTSHTHAHTHDSKTQSHYIAVLFFSRWGSSDLSVCGGSTCWDWQRVTLIPGPWKKWEKKQKNQKTNRRHHGWAELCTPTCTRTHSTEMSQRHFGQETNKKPTEPHWSPQLQCLSSRGRARWWLVVAMPPPTKFEEKKMPWHAHFLKSNLYECTVI